MGIKKGEMMRYLLNISVFIIYNHLPISSIPISPLLTHKCG
jgi:hypothetical protein